MRGKMLTLALCLAFSLVAAGACSDDTDSSNTNNNTNNTNNNNTKQDGGTVTPDQTVAQPDQTVTQPDQSTTQPDSGSTPNCTGCHGFPPSTGRHIKHISKGLKCATCHADTVDTSNKFISATKHRNGTKDVKGSFTWSGGSCSNTGCHGTRSW